ncbi:single-stranded DNA-binding protein [Chromobacterium vaccinii]|nr:single-stranded DNA-binding protein [Chromobacterium vaccinii]
MNSITFDGRLAADAELRYTQSGEAILTFRVASDIGYGERKSTNWFSCQIWGKRGESLKNYLAKGQQVTVYGQLLLREWQDKDGNKRLSPDVRVSEISLQGGRQEGGESSPPRHEPPAAPRRREQQSPAPIDDLDDDGIPF